MLRLLCAFLIVFAYVILPRPVSAQWTAEGASHAGRFGAWERASDDSYSPQRAIGASALAFGPDDSLFLASEKYPDLLIFNKHGSRPTRVHLAGLAQPGREPDIDLEAMSIHDGSIYLFDEDELVVYETPLATPGRVTKLKLLYTGSNKIDNRSTVSTNAPDRSSVEGMVVSSEFLGAKVHASQAGGGPYFYFLDERDAIGGSYQATLYSGSRQGSQIKIAPTVIAFDLKDDRGPKEGYRLPELFAHNGALYALKTRRAQGNLAGVYQVMKCDLDNSTLTMVCDFSWDPLESTCRHASLSIL